MAQVQRARGMRDVLPDEQAYWTFILAAATKRARHFGFQEIQTPVIESQELYLRGAGENSDLVEKELFGVHRLGTRAAEDGAAAETKDDDLVLRPEGTAGLVRAYIEHGMHTWPQPIKLFSVMSLFRYDRPQKGRYRQHSQVDIEVLGDAEPFTDALVILLLWQIFQDLGLTDAIVVELNSIGDKSCRPKIRKALTAYYKPHLKELCADCQRRFTTNPLRLLDCKHEQCQPLKKGAPAIIDNLCPDCRSHFMTLLEYLDGAGIQYDLNPFLVRGLDYYTRTVFEVRDKADSERQASLTSGGRYDNLVESIGGLATPAIGFGLGLERVVEKLQEKGIEAPEPPSTDVLIIQLGDTARRSALPLVVRLGKLGIAASAALGKESLKAQLRSADKMNAKLALIIGQRESIDGTIIVRDLRDGTQETVDAEKVEAIVRERLAVTIEPTAQRVRQGLVTDADEGR